MFATVAALADGPSTYAVTGARILVGTGKVIERGVLVVDDGLIVSVGGEGLDVPEGAWVIDASGKTVYPGFIDALSTLGLGSKPKGGEGGDSEPQKEEVLAHGPEDRPGTFSFKAAADELTLTDERIVKWRSAGFTSAVAVPTEGIFSGQATFINLAGDRERDMVVRTPVGLRLNFERPGSPRSFPASLMGVLAYVRQAFTDAAHYRESWAAYEKAPLGKSRPSYDRTLEPLARAQTDGWPVLFPAHEPHEIERALALAGELGVKPVLYGIHEGYAAAEALSAKKVPVLVSLKWPDRDKDADPDAEESLRVLELRDRAPSTPGALERAGVQFALYSDGVEKPEDAAANLRKAVAAGLSRGKAVSALTLDAASIFGLEDRLGSLEPGKIANFFVASGDVFDEGTRIETVFVDGKKFEVSGGDE
ncbi:MAG TPA: amidohydrolase family protein [Vicinamibacteria bacterium]|nr:amidohydrolase family protein [Vicinamibacteria bacterium]